MGGQSNSSSGPKVELCGYPLAVGMIGSWSILYLLLLPLFLCVLYVGYTRRRRHAASHSDVFTFHIIGMELLTTLGSLLYFLGGVCGSFSVLRLGSSFYSTGITGQMLVHALTCLERYLAVVHPIAYLRLKKSGGVMIRNASIAVVWLFSFGSIFLNYAVVDYFSYIILCLSLSTCFGVAVVAFCSASVLCVLIRPGPGEGGGDLRRVDQSKRRASQTILVIMSVLIVRFIFLIVTYLLQLLDLLSSRGGCLAMVSSGFFTFPSTLVLPLLFLQRAGKLRKALQFFAWRQSG